MANQMLYYDEDELIDDKGFETGPLRMVRHLPTKENIPHHETEESMLDADRRRHARLLRKKIPKLFRFTFRLESRRSSEAFKPINQASSVCSELEAVNRLKKMHNGLLESQDRMLSIQKGYDTRIQLEKYVAKELVAIKAETSLMLVHCMDMDRMLSMMGEELSLKGEILRNNW